MKSTEDYQKGCMEIGEIIIDDPLARLPIPTIQESAQRGNDAAIEFAKKFCEQNSDLLKRLADR